MHLLIVSSGNPAFLYFSHFQLIEYILVFKGKFFFFAGCCIYRIYFIGFAHGLLYPNQLIFHWYHRSVIMYTLRYRYNFSVCEISSVNLCYRVEAAHKIDGFAVNGPFQIIAVLIESRTDIFLLTGFYIHYEKATLVRFVSVVFHALPGQPFAIGRKHGVLVIAHHAFGFVDRFSGFQIIEIDV